jgi:ribosomal protein S12 methylthiotransferase accessory factor
VLELDSRNAMIIEKTMTSSSLDESLDRIQQYLTTRLTAHGEKGLATGIDNGEVIINLGVLGVGHGEDDETKNWSNKIIYPIRLQRSSIILGPVCRLDGAGGPCPVCLERRWLAIRPSEEQQALRTFQQSLVCGHNPGLTQFALEAIWTVVTFSLNQTTYGGATGEFYVLHLDSLQLARYQLVRDSLCPACSTSHADTPEEAVIQLLSRTKKTTSDYRLTKATEYNMPLAGYVNPICGVLGAMSVRDYSNTITTPVTGVIKVKTKFGLHNSYWSGHGNNYRLSMYLGMLEGLERYAGQMPRAKKVSIFDSYENLCPDALNPLDCGLYQPGFYHRNASFYLPFSRERKIPWVWGYSFRTERPILVPEQMVYYLDYRTDHLNFVQECSNGCATGSSLEEAILFGLLELIERDTFLIAWYAKLGLPRIDHRSCQSKETLFMADRIDKLGYDLHLFDMRLDLSPPTVMGVGVRRGKGLGNMLFAAGSGLDPEDAIRAALCEVASYVHDFDVRVKSRQDELRPMIEDYTKVTELQHHGLLYGLPEMASQADFLFRTQELHSVADLYQGWMEKRPQSLDLRDDLQYCITEVLNRGMDVIVVDQTCAEQERVGVKVACVIAPGLMPMDFGWDRQRVFDLPRLRTVPRTSGFLETNFDLAMSNRAPHPFP